MEEFLETHPKLKEVEIRNCAEIISEDIFSVIGKHLPLVKKVWFECFEFRNPSFDQNAFGSLKKLRIESEGSDSIALPLVITKLATGNVPLQFLHLECPAYHQLVAAISDIKTIRTFIWNSDEELQISQWLRICINLPKLTHLVIGTNERLDSDGMVKIIRTAKNLQSLDFLWNTVEMNNETYRTLSKILERRFVKMPLKIYMEEENWPFEQTNQELPTFSNDSNNRISDTFWS